MKVPAACPDLTQISLILGLPSVLVASLATGTSLVVATLAVIGDGAVSCSSRTVQVPVPFVLVAWGKSAACLDVELAQGRREYQFG